MCGSVGQIEEEDLEFGDEYISQRDPSILHFLIGAGDDVSPHVGLPRHPPQFDMLLPGFPASPFHVFSFPPSVTSAEGGGGSRVIFLLCFILLFSLRCWRCAVLLLLFLLNWSL
jgi:hypothetical protein